MQLKHLAACVFVAFTAACSGAASSSHVAAGETFSTGNADYDAFFRDVVDVRSQAEKASADLEGISKPLRDALRIEATPSAPLPQEVVRTEAKKLQLDGTLLHLDLIPEVKVVVSGKTDADDQKLFTSIEQTAKASVAMSRKTSELVARIHDLEKRRAELSDSVDKSFTDPSKREEVKRELKAAATILTDARSLGDRHGGAAARLALDLALAMETGAVGSAKPLKGPPPKGTGTGTKPKPGGDDFDK